MNKTTNSPKETKTIAHELAQSLDGGEVLALVGDLGAGKTTFMQGLAEYFNIADAVSSPTYTLIQEYDLPDRETIKIKKLVHIDCYRLDTAEQLLEIGITDYFERPDVVVVIEWADRAKAIIPANTTWITFDHKEENQRTITIN